MKQCDYIYQIPDEVLKIILLFTASSGRKDLLSIFRVNKRFNKTIIEILKSEQNKWLNHKNTEILWKLKDNYISLFSMQLAYLSCKDEETKKRIVNSGMVIDNYIEKHTQKNRNNFFWHIGMLLKPSIVIPCINDFKKYGFIRYNYETIIHAKIRIPSDTDRTIDLVQQSLDNNWYLIEDLNGRNILDYMAIYWRTHKFYYRKIKLPKNLQEKLDDKKSEIIKAENSGNIRQALNHGWEDDYITLRALIELNDDKITIFKGDLKDFHECLKEVFDETYIPDNFKSLNWMQSDGKTRIEQIVMDTLDKCLSQPKKESFHLEHLVKILQNTDVNLRNFHKKTALMELLEYYKIYNPTKSPKTASRMKSSKINPELLTIAQILIDHGADVNATYFDNHYSILHQLVESDRIDEEILEFLIKNGININAKDRYFDTALMCSFKLNRSYDTSIILLAKGADPTMKNYKNRTALHYAARSGDYELSRLILEDHPEIIDYQDQDGSTALHLCLYRMDDKNSENFLNTLEIFMQFSANINIKNKADKNAMEIIQESLLNANIYNLYDDALKILNKKSLNQPFERILHLRS